MSLFGTQQAPKGTIDEVAHMIENMLKARGLNLHNQMIDPSQGTGWWLREGSAKVYIFVQHASTGPVMRITAPILRLPKANREQFYKKLLDINGDLSYCALATHEDVVLVVSQRPTLGLNQEEVDAMVWNIAYVADLLDDRLAQEFGAVMYRE